MLAETSMRLSVCWFLFCAISINLSRFVYQTFPDFFSLIFPSLSLLGASFNYIVLNAHRNGRLSPFIIKDGNFPLMCFGFFFLWKSWHCCSLWQRIHRYCLYREASVSPRWRDCGWDWHACRSGPALQEHPHLWRNGKLLLWKDVPVLQPRHFWGPCQGVYRVQLRLTCPLTFSTRFHRPVIVGLPACSSMF